MNSREIAYLILVDFEISKNFLINDSFKNCNLSDIDKKFSKEIVYGCIKRKKILDFIISKLILLKKVSEKALVLLRMAFYQKYFMKKIPDFANFSETVNIANKYIRREKSFINALLRKSQKINLQFPSLEDVNDLSIFYSYPSFYVKKLINEYGKKTAEDILKIQNEFYPNFVRVRKFQKLNLDLKNYPIIYEEQSRVIQVDKGKKLENFFKNSNFYIQNPTFVKFMDILSTFLKGENLKVLDLCASPGGKVICLHDLFPNFKYFVNDISSKKIKILEENLQKFEILAKVSISDAKIYDDETDFDLILLDVPCSNSGVFSKKVEARWRFSKKALKDFQKISESIFSNAYQLAKKEKYLAYITCSIISDENEKMVQNFLNKFSLKLLSQIKILPDNKGFDGGFLAIFQKV